MRGLLLFVLCSTLFGCAAEPPADPEAARQRASAWIEEAYTALDRGDWEEGARLAEDALDLRRRLEEGPVAVAEAHAHLAWARWGQERPRAAAEQESTAARLCAQVEPGSDDLRSFVLHLLGYVHQQRNEPSAARAWWEKALHDLRATQPPDPTSIAIVGNDLAEQYRLLGEFDLALSMQRDTVDLARRELGDAPVVGVLLNNLGAMHWDAGDFRSAERLYRQALDRARSAAPPDSARLANAHLNLGVLLRDQLRLREAQDELATAMSIAEAHWGANSPEIAVFLQDRGRVAAARGQYDEAQRLWTRGLDILRDAERPTPLIEAWIYEALASVQRAKGEYERATESLRRAIERQSLAYPGEHPDQGKTWSLLADVRWRAGDAEGAAAAAREALERWAGSEVHGESKALAHATLARVARANGELEAASREFGLALAQIETLRSDRGADDLVRARFLGEYLDWADESIDLALAAGNDDAAAAIAERMRGRVLLDRMQEARDRDTASMSESERSIRSRLGAAHRQLTFLRRAFTPGDDETLRQIGHWENERDRAQREWRNLRSRDAHRETRSELSAEEFAGTRRAALGPSEAALLYHVGREGTQLFVLTRDATRSVRLRWSASDARLFGVSEGAVTRRTLRLALAQLRLPESAIRRDRGVQGLTPAREDSIGATVSASPVARLESLGRMLLPDEEVASVFAHSSLVVIPDDDLHRLPFEMLVRRARPEPTYWLDEAPTIRYAPSLTVLSEIESRAESDEGPVVSFCNPDFGPADEDSRWMLPPLPGTARESAAVEEALAAAEVVRFCGADARESTVKEWAPRARWLHLATHGLVDEREDALLAALAFTDPGDEADADDDGFLHLFEVYELDLRRCQLVLLSACGTQRGSGIAGEGVFALSRGFLSAGAKRTLASLWEVDDASTALLVGEFSRRVGAARRSDQPVDHANALREAKLALRRSPEWNAPRHWAAFVFTGAR